MYVRMYVCIVYVSTVSWFASAKRSARQHYQGHNSPHARNHPPIPEAKGGDEVWRGGRQGLGGERGRAAGGRRDEGVAAAELALVVSSG